MSDFFHGPADKPSAASTRRWVELLWDPRARRFVTARAVDETGRQIVIMSAGLTLTQDPKKHPDLLIRVPGVCLKIVEVDADNPPPYADTIATEAAEANDATDEEENVLLPPESQS